MSFALGASSCADVRFERSPYAIRAVDIVYSVQEELTFIVWRLRDSADPSLVSFELYQDGEYRPLDLDAAPFPAAPYACDKFYLCFQYQLPGRYSSPKEILPLRSIHVDEGLYAGTVPRQQEVERTFGVAPIGVDNNGSIDPQRFDWFALNRVPLQRQYQWQLVDSDLGYGQGDASNCQPPQPAGWLRLSAALSLDYAWVERPKCFAARPDRQDRQAAHVLVPFSPSAELFNEQQDYLTPEERPPVLYLYLIDLLIRSEARCADAKRGVQGEVDRQIGKRQPEAIRLGSFTPTDPQSGRPADGCKQSADQDYPVRQIIETIKNKAAEFEPTPLRVVLIYMNNVELPPSERVVAQLLELGQGLASIDNVVPYSWAIGSNVTLGLFPWDASTPWRPINDETFFGDLKGWVESNVPFRTMIHDDQTEVVIREPVKAVRRPLHFKLCTMTPSALTGVGPAPEQTPWPPGQVYYDWPLSGQPHYTAGLSPQIVEPYGAFTRVVVSTVVETCERFCASPFRTQAGVVLPSWSQTGVCQWAG